MTRDYPSLKPGTRILFVDDYPSNNGYDLMFNLRLLYHDPKLEVSRLRRERRSETGPQSRRL